MIGAIAARRPLTEWSQNWGTRKNGVDIFSLAGELPLNKHKLVVAWIEIHQYDNIPSKGHTVPSVSPQS
jgi:hypothetical protein